VRDGTFKVPGTLFSLITTQATSAGSAAALLRQEGRTLGVLATLVGAC